MVYSAESQIDRRSRRFAYIVESLPAFLIIAIFSVRNFSLYQSHQPDRSSDKSCVSLTPLSTRLKGDYMGRKSEFNDRWCTWLLHDNRRETGGWKLVCQVTIAWHWRFKIPMAGEHANTYELGSNHFTVRFSVSIVAYRYNETTPWSSSLLACLSEPWRMAYPKFKVQSYPNIQWVET